MLILETCSKCKAEQSTKTPSQPGMIVTDDQVTRLTKVQEPPWCWIEIRAQIHGPHAT